MQKNLVKYIKMFPKKKKKESTRNLPEIEKQKLAEYRKKYYRMRKERKCFNLENFAPL